MPPAPVEVRTACIVAGGRGTRLQPLTHTTPKPLLPFCGDPFLSGVIARLAAAGIERVLLVVGDDTTAFEVLESDAERHGVTVETVAEPQPLDTAGGVRSVAGDLDGPFLVLNGDILTDVDYAAVGRRHVEAGADATIVLTRVADTSSYGVCVRDGTRIVDFVEKPDPGELPGQDTVNAGTYVLAPAALERFEPGPLSFERQVFPGILAAGGHIEGFVWDGVWADLGTPDRFREGHRLALDGRLVWPTVAAVPEVRPGVRIAPGADVDDADLRPPVLVLEDAVVHPEAVVGPHVVVGAGARLGRGARLVDTVLFDGAAVGDGVTASGLIAGTGARIDAGAMLGGDNVLGDGQVLSSGQRLEAGHRAPEPEG